MVTSGEEPSIENVLDSLNNSDYGKCVYSSDNNVVDNQIVNLEFENGATASFSMISATKDLCVRKIKLFGSLGEINIDENDIVHFDFLTKKTHFY